MKQMDFSASDPVGGGPAFLTAGGEMGRRMRAYPWDGTSLGPPEGWPQSLKTAVRIMLTSRYAMWMAWGEDLTFFCNDAYLPTLGVKQEWALGSRAGRVWAEVWDVAGSRIDHVLTTGEATWDEGLLLLLERSGFPEETYHTFSYSPLPGDHGNPEGMLCVVTEETERVIGVRRLACLRGLATGLATANTMASTRSAVESALDCCGRDLPFTLTYLLEGEQLRLAFASGIRADHPLAVRELDRRDTDGPWPLDILHEGAAPMTVDLAVNAPGGEWDRPATRALLVPLAGQGQDAPAGFLVAGLSPYRALDKDYVAFVCLVAGQIAGGVANARAYEAERRRAEALAEIDRAKTAFFSNVSHEFRTPLTLMLGPVEDMLGDPGLEPARREQLGTVQRNGRRLLKLVNTLLDFSRIEAGRVIATYRRTDLCALTAELASGFRSACEKAGLILDIDCHALPDDIFVDQDMWEKIVLNLLSNALKFTFDGTIRVELCAAAGGSRVELTVADTGTGIPADELPKLFDRFHRVEGARGRSHEGSGIGLALVQELVRLHGGSVGVESREGEGTVFTVSLPVGSAHLPADRVAAPDDAVPLGNRVQVYVEEALGWLPASVPVASGRVGTVTAEERRPDRAACLRPRIMVADDNADMRDYLRRLLGHDHDVVAVSDGEAALAAVKIDRPDLVLSDMMMPRLDGLGLLAAIRSDPALRDLPVILLSARAGEEARIEGLAAGADDYLVKPFSSKELIARVRAHLALERLRRDTTAHLQVRTTELETLLSTLPVGVWFTAEKDVAVAWGNRAAAELMRTPEQRNVSLSAPEEARPRHFRILRDGVELPPAGMPLQRAVRGEEVRGEEQEILFEDGDTITLLVNASPLRDGGGAVTGAVATAIDITERKQAEERQRLLLEELNHRVKNTLASVQAIALQTLRSSPPEQFAGLFQSRLEALAQAHDLLTRRHWTGARLDEVADLALKPYGADRVAITGPSVSLAPGVAVSLHLAFHELATNAAKYGALSVAGGRVLLDWRLGEGGKLLLAWREEGGPPVRPPVRRGFGTRLIERGLAHDLDGEVKLDFAPGGVRCALHIPFSNRLRLD